MSATRPDNDSQSLRSALIEHAQRMAPAQLNRGSAGNLSVRAVHAGQSGYLITPTGMTYADLTPDDLVFIGLDGSAHGQRKPSSEWRFHHDVYASRPEAGAILHAHSPFAVTLACLRREIPPFHYMIARFGGDTLRCADYASFGTQALSDAAIVALKDRSGCLLANHGMLVFGKNLAQALSLGVELETLCEQYWRACQLGAPIILDQEEMTRILGKFAHYGQQEGAQ